MNQWTHPHNLKRVIETLSCSYSQDVCGKQAPPQACLWGITTHGKYPKVKYSVQLSCRVSYHINWVTTASDGTDSSNSTALVHFQCKSCLILD